ncbi:hypothetical protein D3C72_1655380 [compost metagenome]
MDDLKRLFSRANAVRVLSLGTAPALKISSKTTGLSIALFIFRVAEISDLSFSRYWYGGVSPAFCLIFWETFGPLFSHKLSGPLAFCRYFSLGVQLSLMVRYEDPSSVYR